MGLKVKLVSISNDTEKTIAYCARVSNPKNQDGEDYARLLKYCIDHGHWSIFEMANMVLEINTSRAIAAQILRHRSFSFQEFSQRYAQADVFMHRDARKQDLKNRQNSTQFEDHDIINWFHYQQEQVLGKVKDIYQTALDRGIAKEQARAILPEGLTESTLYMNGTLRSWIHYIDLRTANGTQREHMEIAGECAKAIEPIFPMIKEFNQFEGTN